MEIQNILNEMVGVGEDKDYILKMFKKLEEENRELKAENKELNKQIDLQVCWKENEKTQRIKLEEENRELKASVLTCKLSIDIRNTEINELNEEIKELKLKLKNN